MRRIRYLEIAEQLGAKVRAGDYAPGQLLESEADLSKQFEVSRVTIRKALEELRTEGLVDSRQGFGWFVASDPLRQTLAQLSTIEEQLQESGLTPKRKVIEFAFVEIEGRIADILGTNEVLRVRRINTADGHPFARVTVWCPGDLAKEFSRADVEREPFIRLLGLDLSGAQQTIAAALIDHEDAELLEVPQGSPILRCERVTRDVGGRAVLVAEHVFPGHLTEFLVELPRVDDSIAPTGVRFIE